MSASDRTRCDWATTPLSVAYHDEEWGVPVRDDPALFEFLVLESAQAGLSWETILKKRNGYRAAFDGFDPAVVARYDETRVEALLADPGIVRNRRKIESTIGNARALLEVADEFGSFAGYIWSYVDGTPVQNRWTTSEDLPSESEISRAMSRDMKRRDFAFVGPTTLYAFMQSVGLVNDHRLDCFRYAAVGALA